MIVSTYNWPEALRAVLSALEAQTYANFEVIVADDGSKEPTREVVQYFQNRNKISIKHVWQPDDGFRLAQIRNKAIMEASGDYLIFIDGDCIALPRFIQNHIKFAEPGWFVAGKRILTTASFCQHVLEKQLPIHTWPLKAFYKAFRAGALNRFYTLLPIPWTRLSKLGAASWKGIKGCNMAFWKEDIITVNGFDERYVGWGYEDSDMVLRLLHQGVQRKTARFQIPLIHLWHRENDRTTTSANLGKLNETLNSTITQAHIGINQYLPRPSFKRYPLSVTIITLNEADKIRECLESVKWAEEIIVLDSGSTDDTVKICQTYTDKVYQTDWPGYGVQKNRAIEKTSHTWVLSIDADEVLSKGLQQEIQALIEDPAPKMTAYQVHRRSTFIGKPIYYGDWQNDFIVRLFQKSHGHYTDDAVHETILVNGSIGSLKNIMLHHTVTSLEQAINKLNQYSSLNAQKRFAKNQKASLLQARLHGFWSFVRSYFIKRGFLDGREGFLIATINAQGSFYKYAKCYYLHRRNRL